MKTFRSYLTDLEEVVSAKSLKSTVRFGGETFKLDREGNYDLQGKYKGALYISVGEGSVVSMGVYNGQSTKIVNRSTGEITYGKVPPYSVVVPGTLPDKKNPSAPSLSCAVIIKQVDEKTRSKTSINDLLRE